MRIVDKGELMSETSLRKARAKSNAQREQSWAELRDSPLITKDEYKILDNSSLSTITEEQFKLLKALAMLAVAEALHRQGDLLSDHID